MPSAGSRRDRVDPYPAFNYVVGITDVAVIGFSEVSGLQVELEYVDYREGGENAFVHRLPGPARYPSNLVLRRGMTHDLSLWDWLLAALEGFVVRRNVSVTLRDAAGDDVRKWIFHEAYPIRWTGPELRAGTGALAIEALELAHRGLAPSQTTVGVSL
jgi:phage tail-like protein